MHVTETGDVKVFILLVNSEFLFLCFYPCWHFTNLLIRICWSCLFVDHASYVSTQVIAQSFQMEYWGQIISSIPLELLPALQQVHHLFLDFKPQLVAYQTNQGHSLIHMVFAKTHAKIDENFIGWLLVIPCIIFRWFPSRLLARRASTGHRSSPLANYCTMYASASKNPISADILKNSK